jgi:hypothetical protein
LGSRSGRGVVASFSDNDPTVDCGALEVFLLAGTRSEAVKRARRLGIHGLTLKDKGAEIFDDEVEALLSSGHDMIWRRDSEPERWRPSTSGR